MTKKINILRFDVNDIKKFIETYGYKEYCAKEIFKNIYKLLRNDFTKFDNISGKLKSYLDSSCEIKDFFIVRILESIDGSKKYLFKLYDDNTIESVCMPYERRTTICISTQVGCLMGCSFCATSKSGFIRNLEVDEMVNQIRTIVINENIDFNKLNIVFMGIGEPLLNYDNVKKVIDIISSHYGFKIAKNRITLSTCGIVDKIMQMAKELLRCSLTISLNAPDDDRRSYIMPINRVYSIKDIISAINEYYNITRELVTIAYVLIKDFNDSSQDAYLLANLLDKLKTKIKINLIPYNLVSDNTFEVSDGERIEKFWRILLENNFFVMVRNKRGEDICSACGQLRINEINFL